MNARSARAAAMEQIAVVRGLRRRSAELEAAKAELALRRRQEEQAAAAAGLDAEQAGWAAAIGSATFDPNVGRCWSAALTRLEADLHCAEQEAVAAGDDLKRRRIEWQAARAQSETAEEEARRARGEAARHREEGRLAEQADRAAQRVRFS